MAEDKKLDIEGLDVIGKLKGNDQFLVQTKKGVEAIPVSAVLDAASSTSLYETYSNNLIQNLTVESVTSSQAIKKYLAKDVTEDVYVEIANDSVRFIRAVVTKDSSGKPLEKQATDTKGRLLYWSNNIATATFNDGLPWKTPEETKIFITYEETPYPVTIYLYQLTILKTLSVTFFQSGETVLTDRYQTNAAETGYIKKTDDDFSFYFQVNGESCGIRVFKNPTTGKLNGELVGYWVGLSDIDLNNIVTKDIMKELWYTTQDYYTYIVPMRLNTSDKIGWRLNNDTSNKSYFEVKDNYIVGYSAEVRTNPSTGEYVQEQAKNIFGNLLYWTEDVSRTGGINSEHIPTNNGHYVYMTTTETLYPVYVYQYVLTEQYKVDYQYLGDGTYGYKQTFKDPSGNVGTIYMNSGGMTVTYNNSVVLSANSSVKRLFGNWDVRENSGSYQIPLGNIQKRYKTISASQSSVNISLDGSDYYFAHTSGVIDVTFVIPSNTPDNAILESKLFIWGGIPVGTGTGGTVVLTWNNTIIAATSTKELTLNAFNEFTVRVYKNQNSNSIFMQKTIYET